MSWFNGTGNTPSRIIWSRVRYFRNLSSAFYKSKNRDTIENARNKLSKIMQSSGFRKEDIPMGAPIKLRSLAEKQFIPYSLEAAPICDVYFNEPCSLTISFGDRDLFNICSILSGRALTDALNIASQAEELLDGDFEFAYSDKLGYLSPDPRMCGSGAEFSALLFLPSIRQGNNDEIIFIADSFGASLMPLFSDRENGGDLYILSYIQPHGSDEKNEIVQFEALCDRICEKELENERIIFSHSSIITVERAYRALGCLRYARLLCEEELLRYLSDVRLSILLFPEESSELDINVSALDRLLGECLTYSTLDRTGTKCQDSEECDRLRANSAREFLCDCAATLPKAST